MVCPTSAHRSFEAGIDPKTSPDHAYDLSPNAAPAVRRPLAVRCGSCRWSVRRSARQDAKMQSDETPFGMIAERASLDLGGEDLA
jgi:hypothetical protein